MKKIPYFLALLPILFLIGLLSINVYLYQDESLLGPNQLALILSGSIASVIGIIYGSNWKSILDGIINSIKSVTPAIIILLLIGSLIGTWLISGIVPTMIYYGLQILNPKIFLLASCIICAIVSISTGSSWSTIGTIGIALLGIGLALKIPLGLIGGAIISGSYFGDKMSPLSDTTNLAAAIAGTDLFTHIKYMMYTTIPSFIITLIIFLIIGLNFEISTNQNINDLLEALETSFHISPWLLIVPVLVIILIAKKTSAIPALLIGTLLGGIFGTLFQEKLITKIGNPHEVFILDKLPDNTTLNTEYLKEGSFNSNSCQFTIKNSITQEEVYSKEFIIPSYHTDTILWNHDLGTTIIVIPPRKYGKQHYIVTSYRAVIQSMSDKISINSQNKSINNLLSGKGMKGMMETIWLVICAMIFGGAIDSTKLLKRVSDPIVKYAKSTGDVVTTTAGTCIFFNFTVSDQYLSIIIPGKMFAETYKSKGLSPENLSRTLEDSGTVTSVLVPWNTCGAVQSGVLGIAVLTYLPYCFFNLISPLMTITYAYLGIKIKKLKN